MTAMWDAINNLLFGIDYTREWKYAPQCTLTFKFDDFSLCGVALGDPVDCLRDVGLGPAEDTRRARHWMLCYYSKGLYIEADECSVAEYSLIWRDSLGEKFLPFVGRCTFRGRELPLGAESTPGDIVEWFGEPNQRQAAGGRIVALVYKYSDKLGETVMEVDFGETERLHEISIELDLSELQA
jgi:hypothetical protein